MKWNWRIFLLTAVASVAMVTTTSCHTSRRATESGSGVVGLPNDPLLNREVPADGEAARLLREAFGWLGAPYSYGGHSKKGTDCSGFVMEVFKTVCGISLPRNSAAQSEYSKPVKKGDLRLGDLVFFSSKGKGRISHVGLYIGNGEIIHASTSRGVIVSRLDEKYYTNNYNCAGRVKDFKTSKGKKADQKKAPSAQQAPSAPKPTERPGRDVPSISLDDLIDSKIDSIFSASFMD